MKYPILIYPAEEGGYVAEIISFPGCIAQGESQMECLNELEIVSEYWIDEYLTNHKSLPETQSTVEKLLKFNQYEFA
ncbi:MAG: type II toxin-antitoxin system HicB family antitoxin [Bacteroidetes bacterium]|nr:MAG: type II toxin-antitoxin system HicB family antitoxin [Bacteroidota bacterium]